MRTQLLSGALQLGSAVRRLTSESMLADILRSVAGKRLVDEDGEPVVIALEPPATEAQIRELETALPCPVPDEVRSALQVASGLADSPLESVSLLGLGGFEVPGLLTYAHSIAHDGFGNYWIVDLHPESIAWAPVYFACHDPPVLVYQSPDVASFIEEVGRFYGPGRESPIDQVHEEHSTRIWREDPHLVSCAAARISDDPELRAFGQQLPERALIADLRAAQIGDGFSWGRFRPQPEIVRFGNQPVWALIPPEQKPGLLSRIFGR